MGILLLGGLVRALLFLLDCALLLLSWRERGCEEMLIGSRLLLECLLGLEIDRCGS
jgi:hypothetical protein